MAGVGLIALATGLGAKYGLPGLPKKPPLILAAEGPAKVLPPNQEAAAASQNADSILAKDAKGAKAPPAKIVVNEEQPVDLHLAPPAPAQPPAAAQPAAPLALEPAAVATPAKPAQENLAPTPTTPVVAPAAISPTPAAPVTQLAPPLPVHVVSVRPDGTVIGAEGAATPAAALTPPPVVAAPVGPVSAPAQDAAVTPQATTPKLDFKAKPSAKSTARVATAKIDTTVPATDAPLQIGLPTKLEKAAKAAKAKAGAPTPAPAAEAVAAPTQAAPATPNVLASLASALSQAPAAPAAPTPAPAAATDGGGVFAVQLAAPGSEEEAQGDIKRLKAKYASELGGLEPGVHKADVNGRAVYRVRVTGMSKTGAVALCEKLRASGGACFLAKG